MNGHLRITAKPRSQSQVATASIIAYSGFTAVGATSVAVQACDVRTRGPTIGARAAESINVVASTSSIGPISRGAASIATVGTVVGRAALRAEVLTDLGPVLINGMAVELAAQSAVQVHSETNDVGFVCSDDQHWRSHASLISSMGAHSLSTVAFAGPLTIGASDVTTASGKTGSVISSNADVRVWSSTAAGLTAGSSVMVISALDVITAGGKIDVDAGGVADITTRSSAGLTSQDGDIRLDTGADISVASGRVLVAARRDVSLQADASASVTAAGRVRGVAGTIDVASAGGILATVAGSDAHALGMQTMLLGHSGVDVQSSQGSIHVLAGRHVDVAVGRATVRAADTASFRSLHGAVLLAVTGEVAAEMADAQMVSTRIMTSSHKLSVHARTGRVSVKGSAALAVVAASNSAYLLAAGPVHISSSSSADVHAESSLLIRSGT